MNVLRVQLYDANVTVDSLLGRQNQAYIPWSSCGVLNPALNRLHSRGSIDLDLEKVYQDGLPDHKTVESEFASPILPVPLARLLPPRVTRGVVRRGVAT